MDRQGLESFWIPDGRWSFRQISSLLKAMRGNWSGKAENKEPGGSLSTSPVLEEGGMVGAECLQDPGQLPQCGKRDAHFAEAKSRAHIFQTGIELDM